MRIRQNLSPIRQSFTKAVSVGGSNLTRAVSSGGIKLMRGVDALWNEFEKGILDETEEDRSPAVSRPQDSTNVTPGKVSFQSDRQCDYHKIILTISIAQQKIPK